MNEEDSTKFLPEIDRDFLANKGYRYDVVKDGDALYLILFDFDFPIAYAPSKADVLIILPAGYPNSNPDMFWTNPDVKLPNGAWPTASEYHHAYCGRSWQRWSRHFPNGSWRAGVDNICSYIAAIKKELSKGI